MTLIYDLFQGAIQGLWHSRFHIIHSFIITPIGILLLLCILYGFNVLLKDIAHVYFPSSVFCMLINLLILMSLSMVSNLESRESKSFKIVRVLGSLASWVLQHYLMLIRPPMNFSLKWINVFFIPSFVILPLSDRITFVECMKIAAIFVFGGLSLMIFNIYTIRAIRKFLKLLGQEFLAPKKCELISTQRNNKKRKDKCDNYTNQSYILPQVDITTIDLLCLRKVKTEPTVSSELPFSTLGSFVGQNTVLHSFPSSATTPAYILGSSKGLSSNSLNSSDRQEALYSQILLPMSQLNERAKLIAIFITNYIDWIFYLLLFCVALPLYYVGAIHVMLPFHLGLTVIAYYVAILSLDRFPSAKKYAHPILILTAEILLVCFISSLIYHRGNLSGFLDDLKYYKTGKNYLNLFNGKALYDNGKPVPGLSMGFTSQPMWPGCGDILTSLMDISIVSLSLPMFTHRHDFIKNFWLLMPTILTSTCLTFFCYPLICFHIGISSERSLGFIGRLVTLALGTPLITSLGGSVSLMAVCTILSGICGVLIGDWFFKLFKIPSNDFVTRGVTLGINCGAIATAHLLDLDPRAASMSSLSFSLLGTIMIILASVGAIREIVRSWVGL